MQYDYAPKMGASTLVVAGYIRRSSHMQKENFSADAQKRGIVEDCQKRDFPSPVFILMMS